MFSLPDPRTSLVPLSTLKYSSHYLDTSVDSNQSTIDKLTTSPISPEPSLLSSTPPRPAVPCPTLAVFHPAISHSTMSSHLPVPDLKPLEQTRQRLFQLTNALTTLQNSIHNPIDGRNPLPPWYVLFLSVTPPLNHTLTQFSLLFLSLPKSRTIRHPSYPPVH